MNSAFKGVTMAHRSFYITKTDFISWLQCKKKFFLQKMHPELASVLPDARQLIIDESNRIGSLARQYIPGGKLIDSIKSNDALETTKKHLLQKGTSVSYEPAFLFDRVYIRADILQKINNQSFQLIEVKSSTKLKDHHLHDLAIQYYVITNAGYPISQANLLFVNPDYEYDGKSINIEGLFSREDYTEQVIDLQEEIKLILCEIFDYTAKLDYIDQPIGLYCKKPFPCQYYDYCLQGVDDPVIELPRASEELISTLVNKGIIDISDIPKRYSYLTKLQKKVRDAVSSGKPFVKEEIQKHLGQYTYPIHFLDFEAFNPAIPVYQGTRPYEMIPFQWSDHILDEKHNITHSEFLHTQRALPIKTFTESLIQVLSDSGTIVVFSSFEATRLKEISRAYPELRTQLEGIITRIADMQWLIRQYCYFPEFHGSFSIKNVLPAVLPEKNYQHLAIQNGAVASKVYYQMIFETESEQDKNIIKQNLLEYCKMDTLAMLELFLLFIKY